MAKHRASRRASHRVPRRRGRIAAVVMAVVVTAVAGSAAAMGAIPQIGSASPTAASSAVVPASIELASLDAIVVPEPIAAPKAVTGAAAPAEAPPPPPSGSGAGYRIVFDQSDQRVWLIEDDGSVERTYLVSGSLTDNLKPGSYQVQSRSRHAVAFDSSGSMEYFVRFTTGVNAPIGFHSVPVDNSGELEQTKEQLGTRRSAGCVRQWRPDAIALWDFAPIGTPVVVTA